MKNTPLIKNKELSKAYGFPDLMIKDESKNPFGTIKDRRSKLIIKKALEEKVDKLVLITSGNAGNSLAKFAKGSNIKIVCIIDKKTDNSIKNKLKKDCEVIEVDLAKKILKPKEIISLARKNEEEFIWDVTNGFHEAYETIIAEIKDINPDFLILPIGSGEAFVGCYNGIKKYKLKTKLIGVGVKNKWKSFADKLYTPWTPYKSRINSILKEGNKLIELDEQTIKITYEQAKDFFNCEPSSSVVLAGLQKEHFNKKDKIILINTGKGLIKN